MIRRLLIIAAEIVAFLIMALAVLLYWGAHYIDTDEFREEFAQMVQGAVGLPVNLKGELNIALYPSLSLEILDLSIQEPDGFDGGSLVSFERLLVSTRLIPLLSRQISVRSVIVEGMDIHIVRSSKDVFNWQFLADRQASHSPNNNVVERQFDEFSLSELEVIDAKVFYEDQVSQQNYQLSGVSLRTGRIAPGKKIPFSARTNFAWKMGGVSSEIIIKGVVQADAGGIKLDESTIYATVGGDFLPKGANPGEMTAKLVMDSRTNSVSLNALRVRFLGLMAEGEVKSGDLSKELKAGGNIRLHEFKPADIISRYVPSAPVQKVNGLETGAVETDFIVNESGVSLKNLAILLDDLKVRGALEIKGYSNPKFKFELIGGMVDLDRYLPLFRTDTPFIWDDFALPLLGQLHWQGKVKTSGFKVLDITLNDVDVEVSANEAGIQAKGQAAREGQGTLLVDSTIRIGSDSSRSIPTLGGSFKMSTTSATGGFDFLNIGDVSVTGSSQLDVALRIDTMMCPPREESIEILEHVVGSVELRVGDGKGQFLVKKRRHTVAYTGLLAALSFTSNGRAGNDIYAFKVDTDVRLQGKDAIRAASLTISGPLNVNVMTGDISSRGVSTKGTLAGALITELQSRFSVACDIGFDTKVGRADLRSATVRALETTITGNATFTDLKADFKANGSIEIPNANVRRIIYLLSQFAIRTGDPEALKNIGLKTNFTANRDGFHLSEIEGSLDGMGIKGDVVGRGYNPIRFTGSLMGGMLDVDRFIPDSKERKLQAKRAGKEYKSAPVELPFAFLRWLNVNVKVWLEGLKLADITADNVTGNIEAHQGAINVTNVKGIIHGGRLKAGWVGEVGEKSLTTHLKLLVEDMDAGKLLIDMAGRDYVRGQADVDIDLKGEGRTDDDIVENLNGQVRCRVVNGSFKFTGYDVKPTAHDDSNGHGMVATSDPRTRRTVFQKAIGYFVVKQGVFTVDKFRLEAPPLLQSYGSGNFSLPENTINLVIRNDFVAVPSVTMRLQGELSDPEVNIPKAAIVTDTVRNILSLPEKSFKFLRDLF